MLIRTATSEDIQPLQFLRNHYIVSSNATFDEEPLTEEAIAKWMASFSDAGPHRLLVAQTSEGVIGFASSQPYRAHHAFRKTVETSIYVAPSITSRGVGSALYEALFSEIRGQDLHSAVVGIALPNESSVRLHSKFGFREVGVFQEYALKHGQYISSVWMQRVL